MWRSPQRPDATRIYTEIGLPVQLTNIFNFFIGSALTVFEAGFALKTQGSLVNGFTPLRAGVAGLTFSFSFRFWPILKLPVFFSSLAQISMYVSTVLLPSLRFTPAASATAW